MMIQRRAIALVCSLLLAGCGGPETPQEVTEAFWTAVKTDDAGAVVEYSTLKETGEYDRFSRDDWSDVELSWGTVVIDGADASIDTELSPVEEDGASMNFVTHLVREQEQWRVDYARTADELQAGALLDGLVSKMGAIGRQISHRIDDASRELDANIKSMAEDFRALSRSVQESTSETVEEYGARIRRHMDELADSIDRALKEHRNDVSDEDGETLRAIADDLHEGSERSGSVAESGETLATALQRLAAVDSEALDAYRKQWRQWQKGLQAEMETLLDTDSRKGI